MIVPGTVGTRVYGYASSQGQLTYPAHSDEESNIQFCTVRNRWSNTSQVILRLSIRCDQVTAVLVLSKSNSNISTKHLSRDRKGSDLTRTRMIFGHPPSRSS